jgi:hypothetical protein
VHKNWPISKLVPDQTFYLVFSSTEKHPFTSMHLQESKI